MNSSYVINNYAEIFKAIISAFRPLVCVELGVLEGYSTIAIAEGIKDNLEMGHGLGHLTAYDIFEDYPYRHASMEEAQRNIDLAGVSQFVTLVRHDAYDAFNLHEPGSVSFLHVDLSNTGDTVKTIMEQWHDRMVHGGIICFEGGSEERDAIEWMKKYGAPSIKKELETNPVIEKNYIFGTYFKFPSLTCLLRKR